jgi:hypothetical protein
LPNFTVPHKGGNGAFGTFLSCYFSLAGQSETRGSFMPPARNVIAEMRLLRFDCQRRAI